MLTRLKEKFRAGEITFGLREAAIISIIGMAIGSAAAAHYAGSRPVRSQSLGAPRRASPRYIGSFHKI